MRRLGVVVFREVTSTQDRNLEQVQIAWRNAHPLASAAVLFDRTPNDVEPACGVFDVNGPPKAGGRNFHSRHGVELVAAIPQELIDAGRLLVVRTVE